MPITTTEKIWMNGELIAWEDAKIHVLTHSLAANLRPDKKAEKRCRLGLDSRPTRAS